MKKKLTILSLLVLAGTMLSAATRGPEPVKEFPPGPPVLSQMTIEPTFVFNASTDTRETIQVFDPDGSVEILPAVPAMTAFSGVSARLRSEEGVFRSCESDVNTFADGSGINYTIILGTAYTDRNARHTSHPAPVRPVSGTRYKRT